MSTFAELIIEYTTRIGISDAELARKIGVRRQTIFRWKEGLVKRPRDRQVVLDVAKALRLTPEEQDGLLLSAGFAPETLPTPIEQAIPEEVVGTESESSSAVVSAESAVEPEAEDVGALAVNMDSADSGREVTDVGNTSAQPQATTIALTSANVSSPYSEVEPPPNDGGAAVQRQQRNRYLISGGVIVLIGLLAWFVISQRQISPTAIPTATTMAISPPTTTAATPAAIEAEAPVATPVATTKNPREICQAESENEILLLVARFVSYGTKRYNVAGRILEALEEETESRSADGPAIESLRFGLYAEQISSKQEAEALIAECPAAVLVWGEYDDGRVLAQVTSIKDNRIQFPADRVTQFNVNIPAAVRILALEALGAVLRTENRYADAASSFRLALTPLPDTPDVPDDGQKYNLFFYLGHALYVASGSKGSAGNIDAAVDGFTDTIDVYRDAVDLAAQLNKEDPALLYNRGLAYLGRYQTSPSNAQNKDDINEAIANLEGSLQLRGDYAQAYVMRGNAYMERKASNDLDAAIQDYTAAIELALESEPPDYLKRAYYNRALAYIQIDSDAWEEDLEQALTYNQSARNVFIAKCYGYLRQTKADDAKTACEKAIDEGKDEADLAYLNYAITLAVLSEKGENTELREEAISHLEAHVEWLNAVNGRYDRYQGELADEWLADLQAGKQPFDEETLRNLE